MYHANKHSLPEHARLKDHIATMDGGLEAKINEGYVVLYSLPLLLGSAFHCISAQRRVVMSYHLPDSSLSPTLFQVKQFFITGTSKPQSAHAQKPYLHNYSGSNLSQGQRQLVSLARALLTPSNILVLDEATAAVDIETDASLQATLRSPLFSNRTIITIAHRINTILDSDRIVVLEAGNVKEFDTPKKLLENKQGLFYKLVKEAGLIDGVR